VTDPTPPPPPGASRSHRDARADAKASKAYAKAQRPWYRKKRWWLLGALALIVVIAVAATSGGGGSDGNDTADKPAEETTDNTTKSVNASGSSDAAKDVEVKTCANVEGVDFGQPVVKVTNNSSKRSNYAVTVTVEADGGKTQVDTAEGFVNDLEPGQSKDAELFMGKAIPVGSTCRVTEVTRFAS